METVLILFGCVVYGIANSYFLARAIKKGYARAQDNDETPRIAILKSVFIGMLTSNPVILPCVMCLQVLLGILMDPGRFLDLDFGVLLLGVFVCANMYAMIGLVVGLLQGLITGLVCFLTARWGHQTCSVVGTCSSWVVAAWVAYGLSS